MAREGDGDGDGDVERSHVILNARQASSVPKSTASKMKVYMYVGAFSAARYQSPSLASQPAAWADAFVL